MNDNEIKNKFELSMKEAREGNKKFHWNMAIFAGASLTLLLSFIDKSKPIKASGFFNLTFILSFCGLTTSANIRLTTSLSVPE